MTSLRLIALVSLLAMPPTVRGELVVVDETFDAYPQGPLDDACEIDYSALTGHGLDLYRLGLCDNCAETLVCETSIDGINSADFSPGGTLYVVGFEGQEVVLAQVDHLNAMVISTDPRFREYTEAIAFRFNGVLIHFVSGSNQIKTYHLSSGEDTRLPNGIGFGEVQGIDFDPDGDLWGISSYSHNQQHNILLWINLETGIGEPICRLQVDGEDIPDINSLDINEIGEFRAVTSSPGSVYLIDPNTCEVTVECVTEQSFGALASRFQFGEGCVRNPTWICDGDVDGDGQVNPADVGLVQSAFCPFGGCCEESLCQYDMDCDGQVNPVDSGIVQSLFGTCEAPRDLCP